jgi:Na+/H+ antiporter NhaD/arsenite permease-like protein
MLIDRVILAVLAVALTAWRPQSAAMALTVAGVAGCDVALGAGTESVIAIVAPLFVFIGAALTLARLVERSGLAERTAWALAARARGRPLALYVSVCVLCAALTCAVSLDAAVVLLVPVLGVLDERFSAPARPLFLGVVVVANASSIAVPQGNPTNLVLIDRLDLSPATFAAHMLAPGLITASLCAAVVALSERRALSTGCLAPRRHETPLSSVERHAALSLAGAAIAAWGAPMFGIAPWWPFAAAVAVAVAARRERPQLVVPWRIATQVGALVIVIGGLGLRPPAVPVGLLGLLAVAVGIGAAAALVNNLPASVWAGALLAGPTSYAASIGLAIGSLATRQGSVATLIATDLAGDRAPPFAVRRFAPLAAAAVIAATLLLWAGL